jgi:outer membrane biosynthesis protein TonB
LTRTKAWRLSLATILMFGWVFLTPAHGDDPLSLAAQEIEELNNKVSNLVYQDDFIDLIDIAENKFTYAKNAMELKDDAYDAYDDSVDAEAAALEARSLAQSNVDGQTATVALALEHKDNALEEKNDAQDALSIANINVQTTQSNMQSAGGAGLSYTVYNLLRSGNSAVPGSVICSGTWNSNYMQLPVCGNRYEDFIVKFTGHITVPSWFSTVEFAGYTDDGFRMYVDGQLAVNNWVEQGVRWSAWSPTYDVSEDKTLDVEIWWYNGGGPGSYHLGWTIPGGMTGAGCDYAGDPRVWGENFSCNLNTFSSGSGPTQAQLDAYDEALAARATAQTNYNNKLEVYNDKLSIYNQEVQTLQNLTSNLTTAVQNLTIAQQNLTSALELKNNRINTYDQSIIDLNAAIEDAWTYYFEQSERELNAAIAQAAANAAANQPTPEPSQEPTPEPTDEPTPEPTDEPTPEPTDEPTPEPTDEPTPEPTDEPTPEPTDEPTPEPTDEPTPEPTDEPTPEPTDEPTDNVEIKDEVLAALVPEKGSGTEEDLSNVIANLTSKDNKLVVLSPEQISAVSQTLQALTQEAKVEVAETLGIKASDVAKIAEAMESNPGLAQAFVEFESRAESAGDASMPYTLADATTEVQTEAFLADPIGAFTDIDFGKVLNPSEWGKDMTDDQREKAQEVVIPVIIASNIIAAAMTRRI